jgi:beta-lactam-binding protein with PASTA domain
MNTNPSKKSLLVLVASTLFVVGALAQQPARTKLSPVLRMLASNDPDQVRFAKHHAQLKMAPEQAEPMVDAYVQFLGDPKTIEAYGVRIRTLAGGVATADIPISALAKLDDDPMVIRVEEARAAVHQLDVSVPETGANKVWGSPSRPLPPSSWSGNTGRKVVVGVVDSGIDLNHGDFKDASGNTRLLSVWDQTATTGTPPAGFNYGNECTPSEINALTAQTDIATSNANDNTASVLLGNGTGGFSTPSDFGVGSSPYWVAVGDFNGDGNQDLAVANAGSGTVSILLGNGTGGFAAGATFAAGGNPDDMAVGDFNGDGIPDLAVGNSGTCCAFTNSNVSIFLGKGGGTFGAPTIIPSPAGTLPGSIAVGDFNGDGIPDLAVVNEIGNTVSILLGKGDGTFGPAISFAVGKGAVFVAVGDFNGDGKLDLAVVNEGTCCEFTDSSVSILLGNGDGTFGGTAVFLTNGTFLGFMGPPQNLFAGLGALSVAVGDFNGDGKLDLAVTAFNKYNAGLGFDNDPEVSILLGNGDGTFGAPSKFAVGDGGAFDTVYQVVVGDFNGDGNLDVAAVTDDTATANDSGSVSVLLGNGDGTFGAVHNFPTGDFAASLAVGNFHSAVCPERDLEGHGTHVAGTAAGNGSATFNGQPAYRYIGMAPEANLIVAKNGSIPDAIRYIEQKAAALGMPAVINVSQAVLTGPHDGTSMLDMAVGALATAPGNVVVVAAGNFVNANTHASGAVANGQAVSVTFNVNSGERNAILDLWYPGSDDIGVQLTTPSGTCMIPAAGFLYPGNSTMQNTGCGMVLIDAKSIDTINGDNEIYIMVDYDNGNSPVTSGAWTLTLTGSGCATSTCGTSRFDIWASSTASLVFTNHIDPTSTVSEPATATNVISVGSYMTKATWPSGVTGSGVAGIPPLDTDTLRAISNFSSLGPRRSCSIVSACPAVQKPELAAPGEEIMSSFAAGTKSGGCFDASTPNQRPAICRDPDGRHLIMQGTSMAAPHVTGAVALMLAQDPTLTAFEVKNALIVTARTDNFTDNPLPTPNNTWGYGRLAIDLAINFISPQVTVPNVVGLGQANAEAAITGANLVVGTETESSSPTVPAGNVISENPAAGTSVAPGSAVNLVVSCGAGVPNVVDLAQAAAQSAITNANFVVGTVTQASSATVPAESVISESPAAASCQSTGSPVNLVVSCGAGVPNVVGLTQAAAQSAITNANFVVGAVTQATSTTVPAQNVISENPAAASCQSTGSPVNLVVSCGTGVPNVVGLTQAAAQSAITNANFAVGAVTQASSTTVPAGIVLSESPAAGSCPSSGSPVNIVVSSGVTVPNVVGDTQAAAQSVITAASLIVGTVNFASSSTVPAGSVITENPSAGTSVAAGSAVNLVVSTGPAALLVPNVVGDTRAAATAAITGAGLVVGTVTTASSSTVPTGDVISESPVAGTSVAAGSAVNVVVSSGPAPVNVPNVVGDTQAAATTAITGAGLVVGTVTTASSNTVPAGDVISESPVAGTSVAAGSSVNLVVSTGPAPVTVPNVVGDTQAAATTAITGAGLVVGTVTSASSGTVPSGDVISESPVAGTSVASGSSVKLMVSTGPAPVSVPNVVGDTQAAATTAITGSGLVVGTMTTASSATVPAGDVISESPVAGTSVAAGSAVNLVVSSGPAPVLVPNVVGDTQAAATTTITGAGLVVGVATQAASTTVAAGDVISESPVAGTFVAAGSAVNLGISSGAPFVKIAPATSNPVCAIPACIVVDGSGNYDVTLYVTNQGNVPITLASITTAKLGTAAPTSSTTIANLAAGATGSFTLTFPASAGAATSNVAFSVTGSYSATGVSGNWSVSFRSVTLP